MKLEINMVKAKIIGMQKILDLKDPYYESGTSLV